LILIHIPFPEAIPVNCYTIPNPPTPFQPSAFSRSPTTPS
jgi:hypothetical protein